LTLGGFSHHSRGALQDSNSEVALVTLKTPAFLVVVVQIKVTFEALDAKVDHRFLELGSGLNFVRDQQILVDPSFVYVDHHHV